jgi:hypothetical protein
LNDWGTHDGGIMNRRRFLARHKDRKSANAGIAGVTGRFSLAMSCLLQMVELNELKQVVRILPSIRQRNGRFIARHVAVGWNGAGVAAVFRDGNSS